MSWNKNTSFSTTIDDIISFCESSNIPYSLKIRGFVRLRGINDTEEYYDLRELIVKNDVYLEQMVRNCDCDSDDHIVIYKTLKSLDYSNIPEEIECKCSDCSSE